MRALVLVLALLLPARALAAAMPGWPVDAVLRDVRFAGTGAVRDADLARALGLPGGRAVDSLAAVGGVERVVLAFTREGWLEARVDSLVPGAVEKGRPT
jgi:hypothetical protein